MSKGHVLIVEDDPQIQRLLKTQLAQQDYEVDVVDNIEDTLNVVAHESIDIVLLDIKLQRDDGMEICRRLREWSSLPIIFVTSTDMPSMKVAALQAGADDYVTKPFHMGELVARIEAVLRRTRLENQSQPAIIELDTLTIDLSRREVKLDGKPIHLTRIEFNLLQELATNPGRVLTYQQLLDRVWEGGYNDVRVVHFHVCNLRRKIEPNVGTMRRLVSVPGVGYRFRVQGD